MLDGLDSVNWAELTHAYGSAGDVPQLIRALAQHDKKRWRDAYVEFANKVYHQTTLYEATAYTVPYLLELVSENGVLGKAELLLLLREFVRSTFLSTSGYPENTSPLILKDEIAVYEAVSRGADTIKGFLQSVDPTVKLICVDLLGMLADQVTPLENVLVDVALSDSDVRIRAQAITKLGAIAERKYRPDLAVLFARLITDKDSTPMIRLASAVSMTHLHRSSTPVTDSAIEVIIDANFDSIDSKGEGENWDLVAQFPQGKPDILKALVGLGRKNYLDPLLRLFREPRLSMADVHLVGRELIDLCFRRHDVSGFAWSSWGDFEHERFKHIGERFYGFPDVLGWQTYYVPGKKLNERQRTVIGAIVERDAFWELPTNLFSFFYGLPDSRNELRKLISEG